MFAAVSSATSTLPLITSAVASFIKLYLLLLFVRVLLTWFPNVDWMGQPWVTLRQVTDPYLNLFRNLIPPLMGVRPALWIRLAARSCLRVRYPFCGSALQQIDFTPSKIFGFACGLCVLADALPRVFRACSRSFRIPCAVRARRILQPACLCFVLTCARYSLCLRRQFLGACRGLDIAASLLVLLADVRAIFILPPQSRCSAPTTSTALEARVSEARQCAKETAHTPSPVLMAAHPTCFSLHGCFPRSS